MLDTPRKSIPAMVPVLVLPVAVTPSNGGIVAAVREFKEKLLGQAPLVAGGVIVPPVTWLKDVRCPGKKTLPG